MFNNKINSEINFSGKNKIGKETMIHNDCKITSKPMKYYLQDFKKEIQEDHPSTRGLNWRSYFGPSGDVIDTSFNLRHGCTTQFGNTSNQIGALPLPTTPGMIYGQGNVDIESSIKPGMDNRAEKPCQPSDNRFYKRSFDIFDSLPVKPNKCVDNYVQLNSFRQGVSTRKTEKYIKK